MIFVFKHTCNTVYIVVINEIICVDISVNTAVSKLSVKRMCNFKIVVVIMSAVKCLVKGIVGYTVKSLSVYPAAVISGNDLSHKPEVFLNLICGMT